jgi:hypothetical protein
MDKDDSQPRSYYTHAKAPVKKLRSHQSDPAYSQNAIEEENGSQLPDTRKSIASKRGSTHEMMAVV